MSKQYRQENSNQELVISGVRLEDAGTYECEARNRLNTRSIRFNLMVEGMRITMSHVQQISYASLVVRSLNVVIATPSWTIRPHSVSVTTSETAVIFCAAEGIPEVDYSWFLNGKPAAGTYAT